MIKTLDVDTSENVAMFLDEARVIGCMHHQHIAPAFSVGRDLEGRYFLVMDYIHGRSAAEVWERTLDVDAALPLRSHRSTKNNCPHRREVRVAASGRDTGNQAVAAFTDQGRHHFFIATFDETMWWSEASGWISTAAPSIGARLVEKKM